MLRLRAPSATASLRIMVEKSPVRPTDDEARGLARALLTEARHGALAVLDPETGRPAVTRIAVALDLEGTPLTLVSDLSSHTRALRADPRASLLLGEPGDRGDPLTYPRITLAVEGAFVTRDSPDHAVLRDHWVARPPRPPSTAASARPSNSRRTTSTPGTYSAPSRSTGAPNAFRSANDSPEGQVRGPPGATRPRSAGPPARSHAPGPIPPRAT